MKLLTFETSLTNGGTSIRILLDGASLQIAADLHELLLNLLEDCDSTGKYLIENWDSTDRKCCGNCSHSEESETDA